MTSGGLKPTARAVAALAALTLSACSVYDSKMLDAGPAPKTDAGKDAGKDAELPMNVDASGDDAARPDTAVPCPSDIELCNGVDDDCDDEIDEAEAATADCAGKRPHALNIRCLSGTCYSKGCTLGFADLDGRPQNGCEACPGCDDAGVDDSGVP